MKKIYSIIGFGPIIALLVSLILGSCEKMEDTYRQFLEDGETVYVAKADSLKVRSGRERIELSWLLSDPKIEKVKIYWNNRQDFIEKELQKVNEVDTIRVMIDNLAEGIHVFELYTYDGLGKSSVKAEVSGRVYGTLYEQSLTDANFSSYFKEGNDLKIEWRENQPEGLVKVELSYEDSERNVVEQTLTEIDGSITTLADFWEAGGFRYRSAYIPDSLVIDTFYTSFESYYPFAVNPETFADQIRLKTNLVSTIQNNTTVDLGSGLSYTEINYLDRSNNPMALYVLSADMTQEVTLKATAASNGSNLNAKETVRKQIEHVQDRGHNVLAAVNGDFWRINANETDDTPIGRTYGLLYMDGAMYKPITANFEYYFTAVLDDGTVAMGDKQDYAVLGNRIKEAIGGRYLLVKEGRNVSDQIFNTDIAPRTSIGQFSPDKVVFIVIDGRRADHSIGVSMQDLGKIYEAIGARTAINLDGGGSSTLALGEDAGFVVKNKPSDNAERTVANAWTIVKDIR